MVVMAVLGYYGNDIAIVVMLNYLWQSRLFTLEGKHDTLSINWRECSRKERAGWATAIRTFGEPMPWRASWPKLSNPFCASWIRHGGYAEERTAVQNLGLDFRPLSTYCRCSLMKERHNVKNSKRI